MSLLSLRPPFPNPTEGHAPPSANALVLVRHPGYRTDENLLVQFNATDVSISGVQGVAYSIVHCACAIIANNRFDGFLSSDQPYAKALQSKVPEQPAGRILPAGEYFFHVPGIDLGTTSPAAPVVPWPVVPNFREWRFPGRERLQAPWLDAPIEPSTVTPDHPLFQPKPRDASCRVTQHTLALQMAHLIPASEEDWFLRNNMGNYRDSLGNRQKEGREAMNDADNAIMLRADVHFLFDAMEFSIVPKHDETGNWKWTLHSHYTKPEICSLYHNRQLQPLKGICRQYLLARFAWDIFPRLLQFFQPKVHRWVVTQSGGPEGVSGDDCFRRFCLNQGRGRSSPSRGAKKRREAEGHEECTEDSGVGSFAEESPDAEEEEGDELDSCGDDPYGYKRRARQARLEAEIEKDPFFAAKRRTGWHSDDDFDDEVGRGRKRYRYFDQHAGFL